MAVDDAIDFPLILKEASNILKQHPVEMALSLGDLNSKQRTEGADQDDPESSNESDSENDDTSQSQNISERRRAQNAVFSSWLSARAEKKTKEDAKVAIQNADDEALSIRNLMSKQESEIIITSPREYQIELFERAKKQNIIAVLDTGSGKTLIAVLLLKHILDQELEDRALGKPRRIAFFLVDCVTLVFQQFAVLECNLDQKIDRLCGEMNPDLFTKSQWDKHLHENMAIVCTAEVLYQCLMHSFITMAEINLLIIDEAHHAKKNHAYARIIKDFYLTELDPLRRPKIFGMTASPVDARVDVVQAAKELETLLHSQIATSADLSLLRMSISRPNERIADYEPLVRPYKTPLCAEIESRFGDIESLSRLTRFAIEATSELGEWCADHVWSLALEDQEASKIEGKIERSFNAEKQARSVEDLDSELKRIREAKQIVNEHSFPPPSFAGNSISSKVQRLHSYLSEVFERPTDAKCLVFVQQRYTARLLGELFKRIGGLNLRLGLLVGSRAGEAGDIKVTFRQQVVTLMKFRKGELNCLFATSIAEEGLDIPDCNTIIRFDLYKTLIQYIQSRGRARHRNSRYLHMLERGNQQHLEAIRYVRQGEQVMRRFCEALPADRLLQGNDCNLDDAFSKERSHRVYVEQTTGARLTYGSGLTVLAHFVGCLPHDNETVLQLAYIMTVENKRYVCEVLLPENSPVRSIIGRPSSRKSVAKRSAAFEACLQLRKGGHLDGNLLPIYHKRLPAMRNAHLALNMKKTNSYTMRIKPSLWEETRGSIPNKLHMVVLILESPENLGRPYRPIAILTRTPFPKFPTFPLHLQPGLTSGTFCKPVEKYFTPSDSALASFTSFTLRIFRDVFNKTYEVNEPQMSYWLAPMIEKLPESIENALPSLLIDWSVLDFVQNNDEIPWNIDVPHANLANQYLIDRWDGGRRFFSVGVVPELQALDPVPAGCPAHKYMNSILDYTVSLFSKSRARATWRHDQPVLLAHRILHRRNLLDEISTGEKEVPTLSYVCPEPLRFSALPATVASTSYLFPAIIWRIEAYLTVLEACDLLKLQIEPALALEALTKDSDNTEEHKNEQIHIQRGMGKNYERLEFIGDCFLKMATSISLYAMNPVDNEFESHVKRMLMICNKNLFGTAVNLKLYEYIRSQGFSRRTWYPEGIKLLEGKGYKKIGNEVIKHQLNDKTIADVCEALIGAALLSYRDSGDMDMAVKAVTALVSNPDHDVQKWEDYYKLYTKPVYQLAQASAAQLDLAEKVEKEHNYHFKYPRLLRSAFMHPSYPFSWEKIPSYQRLEFLGDALLDMACVNFLFYRYPDRDPQWLTEHKMAMVSNKFLGSLCVKLGFHRHLRLHSPSAMYLIQEYVTEITEAERESQGHRDYWTITKDPPKCLPDVIEAYLGSIFVDSEFNYKEIERFFTTHIAWFFEDMSIYDTFANRHPTTYLNNLFTLDFGCTNYRVMSGSQPVEDGTPTRVVAIVMIHNQIIAEGEASSGKYAKLKAAKEALDLLQGLAPFEYRKQYGCDCLHRDFGEREGKDLGGGNFDSAI